MFHGSSATEPNTIFSGEYGLDNRYSNAGMYGKGCYFANNSNYSLTYAYSKNGGGRGRGLFGPSAARGGGGGGFKFGPSVPRGGGRGGVLFGSSIPRGGGGGSLFGT